MVGICVTARLKSTAGLRRRRLDMGNVQKRPDGRWRARYRDAAHREHARHFRRRIDAVRWVEAQESARLRGEWVDPALSRITFGEWSEMWLATKASLKPKSRATYASILRARVLPRWADVPLRSIGHADVVAWQADLRRDVGDSMTRQAVDILGQCLALAVRDGRLVRSVAEGVKRPKPARGRQRFLTHAEVSKLAAECPGQYGLLVRLLAYTGLRFGEAAGLRVRNVGIERGRLEIVDNLTEAAGLLHEGSPKSHKSRSVPVPRFLRGALADQLAGKTPDDRVFSASRGGPLRNSNFRHYVFDGAVRRAGLGPLTPHDLRDTAASLAVSAGANVKTVQRMLGHASAAMTLDIYAGLFDDDLDAVGERLSLAAGGPGLADYLRTEGNGETRRAGDLEAG
ncbi:MAG TPA: tyrosine-type recombinase/integrase [Mycobacteriales bacterium]